MSSSFEILEELQKIDAYVQQRKKGLCDLQIDKSNKINKFGEEMLIMYHFLHLLHSKNQAFFCNARMQNYCPTGELKLLKRFIARYINGLISSMRYCLDQE
jgi:hypothetical protein